MLSILELCAGAGGQAIGFETAGFEYVALLDNDPHSCATLRTNRPYWNILDAYHYGAAQHRRRAFLVALDGNFVWPEAKSAGPTVGKTLYDLMAEGGWVGVDEWACQANEPAPTLVGGSRKHGGPDLGPTRVRAAWAKLGVDGLGVANKAPQPDFSGMPRLTDRMLAKLQSFPDDWKFAGSKTQRCRQIGNALTVDLSTVLGKALAKCLS